MEKENISKNPFLETTGATWLEIYQYLGEYDGDHKERQILDELRIISTLAFYCAQCENSKSSRS